VENRANLWKPSNRLFLNPMATLGDATSSQQFCPPYRNSPGKVASVENFRELI